MTKYKILKRKDYDLMKKMGYIEKSKKDGIERGIFRTPKGTASIPVRLRKKK